MKLIGLILRAIYCALVGKRMYVMLLDPETPKTYTYGNGMSAEFIMDGVRRAVRTDIDHAYIRVQLSDDERQLLDYLNAKGNGRG